MRGKDGHRGPWQPPGREALTVQRGAITRIDLDLAFGRHLDVAADGLAVGC
jgi:hypothetical protein